MKNIIKIGTACIIIFLTGALSAQARSNDNHNEQGSNGHNRGQHQQAHNNSRNNHRDHDRHEYGRNDHHPAQNNNHGKSYDHGHNNGIRISIGGGASYSNCGCANGYWKNNQQRIWVPASIGWQIGSCGTRIYLRTPGHWEFVNKRVWVAGHRPTCHHR